MPEPIPTHLIVRYLSNEATAEEQEELFEWVARDSSHQKIFNEWIHTWEHKPAYQPVFNLASGLERINKMIDEHEAEEKKKVRSFSWWRVAASVAFFLMTSLGIYLFTEFNSPQVALVEQSTPEQKITITLSDKSVVILNANSSLKYPEEFNGSQREVFLQGEAFFEVERDTLMPFIIRTGDLTTKVLGTSFNILTEEDQITVTVATGKVRVMHGENAEDIQPEEKVIYLRKNKQMTKGTADLERALAWKTNTIIFDDIRMEEAAQKLEKQFNVSISFEKETLKNCLITGKYKNQPLDKILTAIGFSTGIRFRINGKKVMLYGKGCD